ncbi:hypothetical protein GCM10010104_33110 [Streptomyces indiaensis]|uniref:Uncharacterized protein n=1 Tax=Streptomyces indiaensis TaxID=284033 RepID=A0ABP5QJM7_9ACTN
MLFDGDVLTYRTQEVPAAAAEAFRAKTGWDPRTEPRLARVLPGAAARRSGVA